MSRARHRLLAAGALAATALLAACGGNMNDQQKVDWLEAPDYLPRRTAAYPIPEGTVPREGPWADLPLVTGQDAGGGYLPRAPMPYSQENMLAGEELYHIHCVVCHGPAGYGDGVVVRRGFAAPPSLHDARLRGAPDGYLFDVISHGYGIMAAYEGRVEPHERWQIVMFLRALQLSQEADIESLPEAVQAQLGEEDGR